MHIQIEEPENERSNHKRVELFLSAAMINYTDAMWAALEVERLTLVEKWDKCDLSRGVLLSHLVVFTGEEMVLLHLTAPPSP